MKEKPNITTDFNKAKELFPHLEEYYSEVSAEIGAPLWVEKPGKDQKGKHINVIYPVGDPIFIHIRKTKKDLFTQLIIIEPSMTDEVKKLYDVCMERLVEVAHSMPIPQEKEKIKEVILALFDKIAEPDPENMGIINKYIKKKVFMDKVQYDSLRYFIIRNRVGYGILAPLFYDSNIEDIHCTGIGHIHLIHKVFGMVKTSIDFPTDKGLNAYILEVSERAGRPVSDAKSVIDAIMPDGSRVNILYGRDVSLGGSSFTIRKFADTPVSITQIVNWNTMDANLAAYMWISLENGMNVFVCGETASGKTTTLNAITAFIKPDSKIYTCENTPELTIPHVVWQHLSTRESGTDNDVTYLDLLIAALRSRPDYIMVGEIRGVEGNIAFQAMQTGHSVMSTFHAGNPTMMIQRITGPPINVPITSIDNLNIVLIQMAVENKGKRLRRVLDVTEIQKYYEPEKKVITKQAFEWNPQNDTFKFRGYNNSYILEDKIAKRLGYEDTREIYTVLQYRANVIKKMIELEIFNYWDVWDILQNFALNGKESLPFEVDEVAGGIDD